MLTRTDAVAGLPLVMPVRVTGAGQPRARLTLRFPDGREVEGIVAAVRLTPPANGESSWVAPGPSWAVRRPAEAIRERDAAGLVWFVLADLPPGVVGQEIWLDGKPVALRWLPRPLLLGMRLGFDAQDKDAGVLAHPWSSPVPDAWRTRADLLAELETAMRDPLRAWRADLATTGLFPSDPQRSVGLPPELLDPGILERVGRTLPIETRLTDAVRAQAAARWRVALARLWAADPAVSLRVRQALAGAASLAPDKDGDVVAPAWPANDLQAGALLEMLLDDAVPASERAARAEAWLGELPDAALWVIDDGLRGADHNAPPTIGALVLAAGDASAILMNTGDLVPRPEVLPTRFARTLRPPFGAGTRAGPEYRVLGVNHRLRVTPRAVPLSPPGLVMGPFSPDWTMRRLLGAGAAPVRIDAARAPSGLITAEGVGTEALARVRVVVRLPIGFLAQGQGWEVRVWLGEFGRSRRIVVARGDGTDALQTLAGAQTGRPEVTRGLDGDELLVEILLDPEPGVPSRRRSFGIEAIDGAGRRHAWPSAMLPWQVEPGRRAIDPSAWLGELAD